jgi:hypothetical protein
METLRRFSVRHGWACFGVLRVRGMCAARVLDASRRMRRSVRLIRARFFVCVSPQLLRRLLGDTRSRPTRSLAGVSSARRSRTD